MFEYLLFDLDNTLYPKSSGLDREISRRMTAAAAGFLGISFEEALALRRTKMVAFGTTLTWLTEECGFTDREGFLAAVHPENVGDFIARDPGLCAMLDAIQIPKAVLTNSPREHALRVLSCLGIQDRFSRVFDIRYNGFRGKPERGAYLGPLEELGQDIRGVLFVDDLPHYLAAFREMGGRVLLVDEDGSTAAGIGTGPGAGSGAGAGASGDLSFPSIKKITELKDYIDGFCYAHGNP
ncbi:MAG: HAD family hydrolase [Spirochaetales bacterium]|jgi:putative hydrolase of the HAD superfamily|nr:HAD family hydrolase [Spirochaetales bacterium]